MKKKVTDYVVGDRFLEAGEHDAGTIVTLMLDPTQVTRAFILVRSDEGEYAIYACQRDMVGDAYLSRSIPEPVMRQFLFDVYFGGAEPVITPGATRTPVRLPEYKPAKIPKPQPPEDEPGGADTEADTEAEVKPESIPVEPMVTEVPEPAALLPEVDFP